MKKDSAKNTIALSSFIYCPICHTKISSRLVVIADYDYEGYWVFDSLHCAKRYYYSFGFSGLPPVTELELGSLINKIRRTNGWRISQYTIKVFELLIKKEKAND